MWRPFINRTLRRGQSIERVDVEGVDHVQRLLNAGVGVLITPNHSFHYDSYVLIEAGHRIGRPFHFLTAWQVFAMSKPIERWMLQRHGCFSINREVLDTRAIKTSIEVLTQRDSPLVVFAEGDIYHRTDCVADFREGAAGIALQAARREVRPIHVVPCAMKCFYTDDPTAELSQVLSRLEDAIHWQPNPSASLVERTLNLAEAMLMLKEQEYLGQPRSGPLPERISMLGEDILKSLEARHQVRGKGYGVPQRVQELRGIIIRAGIRDSIDEATRQAHAKDMEDLFFVIQLYSYPGDYLTGNPSIERIAETCDKLEEDILGVDYPGVRGRRRAVVKFGEPFEVPGTRDARDATAQLTRRMQSEVQSLLDGLNVGSSPTSADRITHDAGRGHAIAR